MKNVKELFPTLGATPTSGLRESDPKQEAAEHADLIAAIWRGMASIYGKAWAQYDTDDARQMWAMGLRRLTRQMVIEGMTRLRDQHTGKFPPNLPEFRELCLADRRESAYRDLIGGIGGAWFTDPAAYAVYLTESCHDWRHMDSRRFRQRFDDAFADLDFRRLPEIPKPTNAERIEHKPMNREVGRKKISEFKSQVPWLDE